MNEKVIAIIDKPSRCDWCPLCYFDDPWWRCFITEDFVYEDKVNENCPLRPLPEKTIDAPDDYYHGYYNGRNDCIDELLGETE